MISRSDFRKLFCHIKCGNGPDGTMELREVANLVSSNGSPSSILGPGVSWLKAMPGHVVRSSPMNAKHHLKFS